MRNQILLSFFFVWNRFLKNIGLSVMVSLLFFAQSVFADSSLGIFKLKNCNAPNTHCLLIEGEKAEGSDYSPLFYFKNAKILIEEPPKRSKLFSSVEGYFDLTLGRVVFTEKGTEQEFVFDLNEFYWIKLNNPVVR